MTPATGAELPPAGLEESVGHMLRRERELRGVTLVEVANATRIIRGHLEALEEDRLDDLPGGVFTRGFLRNYADYLGLDPEAVLLHALEQQQRMATRTVAGESGGALGLTTVPGGWGFPLRIPWRRRLLLGLLPVALLAGLLAAGLRHRTPAVHSAVAPEPSGPRAAGSPATVLNPPAAPLAAGPVNFELMPGPDDRRVFVRLLVDGELKFQGELKRTDRLQYTGKRFELYTPSAGALQLRIDGKLYPPLGRRGETLDGWLFRSGQGITAPGSPGKSPPP